MICIRYHILHGIVNITWYLPRSIAAKCLEKRYEIGQMLRKLCKWKGVNVLEAEVCPDHIRILVEIPPKISVAGFMGFLKGKSSLLIYDQWSNIKFKYRNREFLRK